MSMPTFTHGSECDVYGDGWYLSEYFNSAGMPQSRDTAETTTFKKKTKTYIPGLRDNTMSLEGFSDETPNHISDIMHAAMSAPQSLWTYASSGAELGNRCKSLTAFQTSFEVTSETGDANKITAEVQGSDSVMNGTVVKILEAASAGNSPGSVQSTLVTNRAGELVVHASIVTSSPLVVSLQDSANGTVWADLASTSLSFTGRGALALRTATTVRQYLRAKWTGAGTFFVAVGFRK